MQYISICIFGWNGFLKYLRNNAVSESTFHQKVSNIINRLLIKVSAGAIYETALKTNQKEDIYKTVDLQIISKDNEIFYYPLQRLLSTCQNATNVAGQIHELKLDFTAQAIRVFLNFLDTLQVDPHDLQDLAIVADYSNLHYLNPLLSTRSQIIAYLAPDDDYYKDFFQAQSRDPEEWWGLHYFLSHQSQFEEYKESLVSIN
jgi:hypothetical protein